MQHEEPLAALRAVPMDLFPTMDSLQAVMDLGISKMPINHWNEMYALLCIYHNTLLNSINNKEQHHGS